MKRLIYLWIGILWAIGIMAQSVSKELATRVAIQYMRNDICNAAPDSYNFLTRNSRIDTTYTSLFSPTGKAPLYLVQLPQGWILVSSEFVGTPVLASAPDGQFPDATSMPDGLKWLLSYYENAMQYTRDSLLNINDDIFQIWEEAASEYMYGENNREVSSLPSSYTISNISSYLWNQRKNNGSVTPNCSKVYNKFCPIWYNAGCGHTYAGCIAVAMGIIMRYYQWPYSAIVPDTISMQGTPSTAKHFVAYDWNNMPGTINNSTDVSAVNQIAGLLRDCGYSSKMEYGEEGSGANMLDAKNALNSTFRYHNATYHLRDLYVGNWMTQLKTEIAADRPVIYSGNPGRGIEGHTFVLFGYTTTNMFKINWGWADSTANNGVYSLDNLIPVGHTTNYNDDQEAIWGITPNYPSCSAYTLQQSDVNSNYFEVYKGGAITAQNITINNNRSGAIYSGASVTLTSSFKIELGSHVIIDIKDMHCNNREEMPNLDDVPDNRQAPPKRDMPNSSTSARKIMQNGQLFILRDGKTYTATGQEVR